MSELIFDFRRVQLAILNLEYEVFFLGNFFVFF